MDHTESATQMARIRSTYFKLNVGLSDFPIFVGNAHPSKLLSSIVHRPPSPSVSSSRSTTVAVTPAPCTGQTACNQMRRCVAAIGEDVYTMFVGILSATPGFSRSYSWLPSFEIASTITWSAKRAWLARISKACPCYLWLRPSFLL